MMPCIGIAGETSRNFQLRTGACLFMLSINYLTWSIMTGEEISSSKLWDAQRWKCNAWGQAR